MTLAVAPLFAVLSTPAVLMGLGPGRGRGFHWYDLIIIPLCAVIVFPDKFLDWVGERTGSHFGWAHIVLLEVAAIAALALTMALLLPSYPKLQWWYPLLSMSFLTLFRMLLHVLVGFFGFRD